MSRSTIGGVGRAGVLAGVVALAGCAGSAPDWSKSGASDADRTAALGQCTQQATDAYPVLAREQTVSGGYNTGAGTGCGFSPSSATTSCSSGGNYVQPTTRTVDDNLPARNTAIAACMMGKGWQRGG